MSRHFERFFKQRFQSYFLWGSLLILGVVALSFRGDLKKNALHGLPFGHPIQPPALSCQQVLNLADWGQRRFGGMGQADVFNPKRAKAVAEAFLEKLDPNRMLFLSEDVEAFKKLTEAHWNDLVQRSSCEPWEQWLQFNYKKVQQRTAKLVKIFKAPKDLNFMLGEGNASSEKTKELKANQKDKDISYTQFAVSYQELQKRWQKELTEILSEGSFSLIKAYQGNVTQLLWDRTEQRYFDSAPETRGLLAKAILAGLDPYSTYFSSGEFEDFYEELKGTTAGLGLRLQKVPQGFLVEKVIEGSASQRSKEIEAGDIIRKIDDVVLAALSFEEAKNILKGPENSQVKLGIECHHKKQVGSEPHQIEVVLQRTQFEIEETKINFAWKASKKQAQVSKRVAVISVPTFYGRGGMGNDGEEKSVSEDFKQRITEELLKDTSHLGLVLDLRGNPGGYLEEAVSIGSFFVGNRPIVGVIEEGSTRILKEENSLPAIYKKPLVVLVDQSSASAAEVLSGALKDYQRAVIVGSAQTYGKGTVQKLFHLEDPLLFSAALGPLGTGVVKLTTSIFYSPLGHTPANGGVKTDITLNENRSPLVVSHKTEDILPIVDNHLQQELEKASLSYQDSLHLLSEKSKERLSREEEATVDSELDEAIAIVSDIADLKTPHLNF